MAEQRTPEEAVRRALEQVGEDVTGVLQRAYETAQQIIANAEHDAAAQRSAAEQDAAASIALAEERLRELDLDTDRIWGERERILADARELAGRLTALIEGADARFPPPEPVLAPQPAVEAAVEPAAASLAGVEDVALIDEQLDAAFAAEEPAAGLI